MLVQDHQQRLPMQMAGGGSGLSADASQALPTQPPPNYARAIYEDPNVRFFLMRSRWLYNIEVAMKYNMWATRPHNEAVLKSTAGNCRYVVLFFSVNGTSYFCGWAIMRSLPGQCAFGSNLFKAAEADPQSGATRAHFEGNTFDLEWIRRDPLDFRECSHLLNPYNRNLPVFRARDGQEIAPAVGKELCAVFESQWLRTKASLGDIPTDHLQPSVPAPCHPLPALGASQQAGSRRAGGVGCVPPPPPPVGGIATGVGQPVIGQPSVYSGRFSGQQQDSMVAKSAVPPPPPPPDDSTKDDTAECVKGHDLSRPGARIINPAIQIYPVDLTCLTYDGYIQAYQQSRAFWEGRTRSLNPEAGQEDSETNGGSADHESDEGDSGEAEEKEESHEQQRQHEEEEEAGELETGEDIVGEDDGGFEHETEDVDREQLQGTEEEEDEEHSPRLVQCQVDLNEELIEYE
ncbi:yt521-b family protein [Cystoisospora suis]|uniref:Yt521-b family protein n=1 Tax=Cystoisospora suis TaxID=483139 RepID=A0A2C6KLH3_9APIC|nr:yt521-b family protein [Cystoisospora suis]